MKIEDAGEIKAFEAMPKEGTLYLTAVCFNGSSWCNGPSSMSKEEVIRMLGSWTGATHARIYAVKVPLAAIPAA